MLRNIFVLSIIAFGIYASLRKPFWGLLFYLWISYFRPERWIWNGQWLQDTNLSFIVGIYVVVRAPFDEEAKFRLDTRTVLMIAFLGLDLVSTLTSPYLKYSQPFLEEFSKTVLVTYLLTVFLTDYPKFRMAVLIIALSLGFETAKQGWLDLFRQPGIKNLNTINFIGDENEVAIGLLMLVPLLSALAQTAKTRSEAFLHRFLGVGVFYRAIITYSRGGFLACGAMAVMYIARSKHKIRSAIAAAVLAYGISQVMTDDYWDRMSTIHFSADALDESDYSSRGRLHFWEVAKSMAAANPFLGVGHNAFYAAYNSYDFSKGEWGRDRAVHSVWYAVLSELGYTGILLYSLIILTTIIGTQRTVIEAKRGKIAPELGTFAVAIQMGFAAFIVGASFVSWQYDEMLWHFFGLGMALRIAALGSQLKAPAEEPEPAPVTPGFQPVPAMRST